VSVVCQDALANYWTPLIDHAIIASMAEMRYLQGRVVKRSLPVIEGRPDSGTPLLKRLMLAQGELAQVHDDAEGIRYLAVVELRAGCVRGNHYHKIKREYVYVIAGEALLAVEDPATRAREVVSLRAGDLAVIEAGMAHAMHTVSPGCALEFSPTRFNQADTFPFPLECGGMGSDVVSVPGRR
jgi:mannose-6-phosphate isomerase-like protein (cupin superfamily)